MQARLPLILHSAFCLLHLSDLGFGFAEAGDAVAVLPLAALFEKFGALKALPVDPPQSEPHPPVK